jgi:putative FmdB family regulatory protein
LPRYDYRCEDDACENDTFEVSKSYSDDTATVCPACSNEARRLLSPIAVHFKGSGFYVTDNRASNGASGGGTDSSDSGDPGSKSDPKKTESKSESETKTESKSDTPKSSSDSKSKSKAASSSSSD